MSILDPNGVPVASAGVQGEIAAQVTTTYSPGTSTGGVLLQLNGQRVALTVLEARALGMQLILQSEACIGNAALIRSMMELGGMPLEFAVQAQQVQNTKTREAQMATEPAPYRPKMAHDGCGEEACHRAWAIAADRLCEHGRTLQEWRAR